MPKVDGRLRCCRAGQGAEGESARARCAVTILVSLLSLSLNARGAEPDGQYIQDWLVAGPVPAETASLAASLAAASDSLPAPEDGRSFRLPGGEPLQWNRYSAPGSIVNLNHALGPRARGCALACTVIHAEQPCQVTFLLGSSDAVAILMNRRVVYLDAAKRPFCPDQTSFTATLQAGDNDRQRRNQSEPLTSPLGPDQPCLPTIGMI